MRREGADFRIGAEGASLLPGLLGVLLMLGLMPSLASVAEAQDAPTIGGSVAPAEEEPAPMAGSTTSPAAAPSAVLPAGTPAERYAAGVAAYERQDHETASAIFRALVDDGHAQPAILLAMGNAAFRRDRFVEAVYAYEWARMLAPNDEDVAANLELARAHLVRDELPSGGAEAAMRFREILRTIPTSWTALAFAGLWCLGWGILALRQRGRTGAHPSMAVAAILLAIPFAAHVAFRVHDSRGAERGMLQLREVDVRSGPGESYATLFTLHAGTMAMLGEERGGWRRITLSQGSEGWVPETAVAIFNRIDSLQAR